MIKSIALLLLLASMATALAQENQPDGETQDQPITPANSHSTENSASTAGQTSVDAENYRPSEEISEDLSVSFPVDI